MTPRRRLSNASRAAVIAARKYHEAQDELHEAFEKVYGFELDVEKLGGGDAWVDTIVYGMGSAPSLTEFDAAVKALIAQEEQE
ncbi:MAG: hypothetical protein MJH10_20765 [Epibacterium sp.]|nr:hypothetical protein [Epibacterium sp.]NQX75896.1 hypothetical protein [Epibacterium sp.]